MSGFHVGPPPPPPERRPNNPPFRPPAGKTTRSFNQRPLHGFAGDRSGSTASRPHWMISLMRLTQLSIYGDYGLTPSVFKNLAAASILLTILWFFDAGAWTLLLNMLLTGSLFNFHPLTFAAILLGPLAATGILFYESSFITSDFRRSANPKLAIGIRLTFIIIIAFATSIPIDLFLLDSQVNRRIHEEQVLQQLPPVVKMWEDAQQRETDTSQSDPDRIAATVPQQAAVDDAKTRLSEAQDALSRARTVSNQQNGQVATLTRHLNSPDLSVQQQRALQQDLQRAQAALAASRNEESRQSARVQQAASTQSAAALNLMQSNANFTVRKTGQAKADATRYENWITDLWTARPLTAVTERGKHEGDTLTYDGETAEGNVGIGERLIAMTDILQARPPKRPSMSSTDLQALESMKLSAFVHDDPVALERAGADASSLRKLTAVALLIFTIFPALIMALKGLFDEDTRRYFDSEYQRSLGNPDFPPLGSVGDPAA